MIKRSSFIAMFFSLIISTLGPVLAVLYLVIYHDASIKTVLLGALIFFITQIVIRIPLIKNFSQKPWFTELSKNTIFYSLFLALTAGIFEEAGRFLGMNYLLHSLSFKTAVAFGLGHGGLESILFVGFTYYNNIVYSLKINQGKFDEKMGAHISDEQTEEIKDKLLETPTADFLLGGIERVFAIIIQIVLSIMIYYGIINGEIIYLLYAVLLHVLIDGLASYIKMEGYSVWIIESFLFLLSSLGLIYIINHF